MCIPVVVCCCVCIKQAEFRQSLLCTLSSESSFSVLIPAVLHRLLQRTQHLKTHRPTPKAGDNYCRSVALWHWCAVPLWNAQNTLCPKKVSWSHHFSASCLRCSSSITDKLILLMVLNCGNQPWCCHCDCGLSPSCSSSRLQGTEVWISLLPQESASPQSSDGFPAQPGKLAHTQEPLHLDTHHTQR